METKGKGFGAIRGYAGGGLIAGLKGMLGMKTETVTEKFARQDAEFRAKHPERFQQQPAEQPKPAGNAISDYAGMSAMQKREKAAGLKAGGMVRKPQSGHLPGYVPGPLSNGPTLSAMADGVSQSVIQPMVQDIRQGHRTLNKELPLPYQIAQVVSAPVGIAAAGLDYADNMQAGNRVDSGISSLSSVPVPEVRYGALGTSLPSSVGNALTSHPIPNAGAAARALPGVFGLGYKAAAGVNSAMMGKAGYDQFKQPGYKAGGMVKKCVTGGKITGPGGPTDDLVPIMASDGEFMIKAKSAKILGPELLEALNDVGGKEESKNGDKLKVGGMIRKMSEGGTVNRYHSTIDDAINAEVKPPKPGSDLSSKFGMIKAIGRDAASMFDLKEGTTGTNIAAETVKQAAPMQQPTPSIVGNAYSDPSRKLDVAPPTPIPMPTMDNGYRGKSYSDPRNPGSSASELNDPASNASILAQNPAGAVRRVGNSYSGANVSGNVGLVGADGNPISGRPGGGYVAGGAPAPVVQSLANPDGSQWTSGDNAIMAANIRDGIDPTRGTSRGHPGGASIIGGPAIPGGDPNDLLSANHEAMRRASIAATRSGDRPEDRAMRAAGSGLIAGLGQQFGQARQDQQANARTAMTTQATQAQTDATSRNQAANNQIAQAQLGLNRQKQTQDNALARDKLAADTGMEKIRQQLWAAYTNGTPEQKAQAAEQLQMMNGKDQSGSSPFAVPGGQGFNADGTPYTIASSVFDPSTKQFIQQGGQGVAKATTKEEFAKMPSGTAFTAPDGSRRIKP